MFAPLSILTVSGSNSAGEVRGNRELVDSNGFNLNIASLTNDVSTQQAYSIAVTALFPPDILKYFRNNTYGITSPTGTYPTWMGTNASYWPNCFRRAAPENYHDTGRRQCVEPLAAWNNEGIGPAATPFGRDTNKLEVANASNTWRAQIRWRSRILLSTEVGPTTAQISAGDLAAVRDTNAKTVAILGPNEIDATINWKAFYLNYTVQPDEITTSTPWATITLADTIFNNNLQLLFLRIADHMKHTWFSVNDTLVDGGAGRSDCAVLAPSIIRCSVGLSSNTNFTVYNWLDWEDMNANVLLRKGEWLKWCDAPQVHIHVDQSPIPNPWLANPLAPVQNLISPYHWWTAKQTNESYRIGLGLDPLYRPLVNGECGIPTEGSGVIVDGRTDRNQLRRLKYGILAAGNLYYGVTMTLSYTAGLSSAYGYNLLHRGNLWTVSSYAVNPSSRGTGYVVGTIYQLSIGSGNDIRPTFKVTSINGSGGITGLLMNYAGYTATIGSSVALVAPSGGTAAFLTLTWITFPRFTREGESADTPNAPAQAVSAGLTTLFFREDFTSLDFYHRTSSPEGKWRFIDFWQEHEQAGYVDFAGGRTFMVNQMTTGTGPTANQSDAAAAASIQPYLPASLLDSTTLRLHAQRALLSTRPALKTTVNAIEVGNQGLPADTTTWLGSFMTTERFAFDTRYDIHRPAYIEFRIRFTPADINGVFSSVWIYTAGAESHPAGDGKETVEIDMFETDDVSPLLWKTNIHKDKGPASGGIYPNIPLTHNSAWIDGNFHVYGLLWEPNSLKIYRDNVLSNQLTGADADWFSVPMRLMITNTVDPYWAAGLGKAAPPATNDVYMDLDYIYVWRP